MTDRYFEAGPDGLSQYETDAMDAARCLCWKFGITDDADKHDTVQEAWVLAQARKETPGKIGWNACQRIVALRHLKESSKSVTSPKPTRGKTPKPKRASFDIVLEYASEGDDPAELATFQIDFDEWLKRLPKRKRKLVKSFLKGLTTPEAANRFKVSASRISQIRRELETSWEEQFTGD